MKVPRESDKTEQTNTLDKETRLRKTITRTQICLTSETRDDYFCKNKLLKLKLGKIKPKPVYWRQTFWVQGTAV